MRDDKYCANYGEKYEEYCDYFDSYAKGYCPGCTKEKECNEYCSLIKYACLDCLSYKHKWPTPAQFRREYGFEPFEDKNLVWVKWSEFDAWYHGFYNQEYLGGGPFATTIDTVFGKPPDDYRPKDD